jgi:hypothetical protein
MAGPLEGDAGDPGVPTTYPEDVDGSPPLRGDVGDPRASTTYPKDVDGEPPGGGV